MRFSSLKSCEHVGVPGGSLNAKIPSIPTDNTLVFGVAEVVGWGDTGEGPPRCVIRDIMKKARDK